MLNAPIFTAPFIQTLTFPLLKFMTAPIDLKALFSDIPGINFYGPKTNPCIRSLALHSKYVQPHGVFFAIPGNKIHGESFIEEAIERGAEVIVIEKIWPRLSHIVQIQTPDVRDCVARVAHKFFHQPDACLRLTGITGTSGKTTTSWMVRYLYQKAFQEQTGLLGSLQYDLGQRVLPALLTTPDAITLTSYLEEMVQAQQKNAVMEVSSHALEQKRTAALQFDTAVFTNLSVEHQDYHQSMEGYYQAKRKLFFQSHLKHAVINIDDAYGARLYKELPALNCVTFGLNSGATLQAQQVQCGENKTNFTLMTPYGAYAIEMPLVGLFNVYNVLAALGVFYAQGYDLTKLLPHLKTLPKVPGRLEAVPNPFGIHVFVDFAHKPEALRQVLQTVRSFSPRKLFLVFGCGGDRDRTKRPLMTQIATEFADQCFATSDNPRTESQAQIFEDMRKGCVDKNNIVFIQDRVQAICEALQQCSPGDCLIIAGKGHEQYQEIQWKFYPLDDKKVVESYIQAKFKK